MNGLYVDIFLAPFPPHLVHVVIECPLTQPILFQVQPWQNTTQLESFQAELNSFYHNPKNMYGRSITNDDVAKGDKFYAGQHMDGKWYRVKVNASIDEGTVAAKIVDFGDFTMIPLESLQPLWPQFRNLPMQAISASLAGMLFETII